MLLPHCPQAPQVRITFQVSFVVAASGGAVTSGDDMAGHASIQTNQRYIDVNDERMRRAAELI
jgi:hypothetical protein